MPLWERYRQCLTSTDPTELFLIIEEFDHVGSEGTTPSFWMGAWGDSVKSQPIRTAVDPQALGAACTLRVAGLMVEAQHLTEGRALYRHVVTRYSSRDLTYYSKQAKEALAALQVPAPTVVVSSAPSR